MSSQPQQPSGSQELFRLKPHEHRIENMERYVVLQKSVSASRPEDKVSLLRLRFQVTPLNIQQKVADRQKVLPMSSRTRLDAIIDHQDGTVEFLLNEPDAALPEELRGAGVGSYILSTMIRWAQGVSGELRVVPLKISTPETSGTGREERLKRFFGQLGFQLVAERGKGLFAVADTVGKLGSHVNSQKVESVSLVSWGNEWLDQQVNLANQLREESQNHNLCREQLVQLKHQKTARLPFFSGALAGSVVGLIVGLLISL